MKATITIDTENFEVTCRATTDDLDIAEALDLSARYAAAELAQVMCLPHFGVDVRIGEFFEYRENVAASVC